jgi:chloramphenicol-sensitive protein RarD
VNATDSRTGLLYGLGAYGAWGLIPLYFKAVGHVPPLQILAHRVIWSFTLLVILVWILSRGGDLWSALKQRRVLATLAVSTLLIAINWLTYIYAVTHAQVLQASLGYFVTPLANVVLGVVFLRERLRPWQVISVLLALVGVILMASTTGAFPWIAFSLAVSFSFYGLLRKTVAADGLLGLVVETGLLFPLAAAWLVLPIPANPPMEAAFDVGTLGLLMAGGAVTAAPLLCFAAAARRVSMTTLGILQYLAPTVQFFLAVLLFHEPLQRTQLISFGWIWIGVAVYIIDSIRRRAPIEAPVSCENAEAECAPDAG